MHLFLAFGKKRGNITSEYKDTLPNQKPEKADANNNGAALGGTMCGLTKLNITLVFLVSSVVFWVFLMFVLCSSSHFVTYIGLFQLWRVTGCIHGEY